MTDLTVKELCSALIFLGSLITAVSIISAFLNNALKKLFRPLDVRDCRVFLVNFLCDLEQGIEKDEAQWQLAHEIYDHYTIDLKENSYVHDKWERVVNHVGSE